MKKEKVESVVIPKEKVLDDIINQAFYDQEKELMVLLISNPMFVEKRKLIKFPIESKEIDEGTEYIQPVAIVPNEYRGNKTFYELDKDNPTAIFRVVIRL